MPRSSCVVGDGRSVDHVKIAGEGDAALHVATLMAAVGAQATLRRFHLHARRRGGAQPDVRALRRRGTRSRRRAARICCAAREHADTTLVVDHAVGGCTSREVFKAVLDGESRGVFQGKIIVRPDAQKTDAQMMSSALLLSEDAEADNKPELEIFADDVLAAMARPRAARREVLFYLLARGIPEGGRGAADPGLPRRGDRDDRAREACATR